MIKSHFVGTLFFWLSVDGSILPSSDALIREIWLCTRIGYVLDMDTGGIWVQTYPERIKAKKKVSLFWVRPRYGQDTASYIPDMGRKEKGKKN